MTGLLSRISSDTATVGEFYTACTGRGSFAPVIVGNREDPDLRFDGETRLRGLKDPELLHRLSHPGG